MPTLSNAFAVNKSFQDEICSIILDASSSVPLHCQLSGALRKVFSLERWNGHRLPPEGELASLLRVSVSTVRQALAPLVAEKLIDRQRAKGSFVRGSQNTKALRYLTVIKPNYPSPFISYYMDSIRRQAAVINTEVKVVDIDRGGNWKDLCSHIGYSPDEGSVLLLKGIPISTFSIYNLLSEKGYRTVSMGSVDSHYPGDFVGCNDRSAIHLGIKTLRDLGHRRIAFLVSEPEEFIDSIERVEAFKEFAALYSLPEAKVIHCGVHVWEDSRLAAAEAMNFIWEDRNRPTAIFAVSDAAALGVYSWLQSHGHTCPKDVSLLSFDGIASQTTDRQMASLVAPIDSIIREAFRLLKSPGPVAKHLYLDPTLEFGKTIGSPISPAS